VPEKGMAIEKSVLRPRESSLSADAITIEVGAFEVFTYPSPPSKVVDQLLGAKSPVSSITVACVVCATETTRQISVAAQLKTFFIEKSSHAFTKKITVKRFDVKRLGEGILSPPLNKAQNR
jgi:hypothetical protein